ncbi:phage protein [Brachybacterium sp. SW0106-09]|uniref:ERF family protein n=1 Tax=Brachybacterium sp. SW0106-09 TaxID=1704590 RepID=UPI0006B59153|nr:ERF family protein [Brachybacterium sp. SW0106-09]GAP78542.1 phage protein [Brachybacterium sp. SW0106-09]
MSDKMTAAQSMVAVMERVRGLGKHQRNDHFRFQFRGIDDVMNAVGPALREVGAVIVPEVRKVERQYGGKATSTVVEVAYHWHGPDGSIITGVSVGESQDMGDKSVPKAMSVAFRTYLLQALTLPTDEPDPDAQSYSEPATADADRARAELRQMCGELKLDPNWAVAEFGRGTGENLANTSRADLIRAFIQRVREEAAKPKENPNAAA